MRTSIKWLLGLALGLVLLLAAALFGLWRWAASDDFRQRAQQQASQALGLPVQLGAIRLSVWPAPSVAVDDVRVQTRPPLTLERVEARPVWSSLLAGRPELDALVVRNAVLPQQGLVALATAVQKQEAAAGAPAKPQEPGASATLLPRRIVLDHVTWVDAKSQRLTVDAEVAFENEPLPQSLRVDVVAGRFAGAKARLQREADAWQLRADIGGGTVSGPLRLQSQKGGAWRLTGDLATERVEVSALTAPSRALAGKLDARTSLQAEFRDPAALADALRSQTRFTVRNAVLQGVDLAQAVRTLGASRGGQTALDTLTGNVATQGRVVHLTNLVASSGLLSATGHVTLAADRSLSGRVEAKLTAGPLGSVAGVPLQVAGTLDQPSVTPVGVSLPGSGAASHLGEKVEKGLRGLFGR
ncbi:AsmA family protein [Ramlibacter tataouinensis]|uniref:AsmA family protein n=1 Tax=Ramlibacter tataouinensis TaxID=94132 RepID=UPI0022F396C6|nr:AsmA family protein [Ramlibacter tataouinensis]WBY00024.1 AsmA family protein [Ramlibacter tataouinensis]